MATSTSGEVAATRGADNAVSIRPAVEADLDDLGHFLALAFAGIMKNVFPSGCNLKLIELRRHTMRKLFKGANEPHSTLRIDVAVSRTPEGEEQRIGFIMWRFVGLNGYEEPHPSDDAAPWPSDANCEMHQRFMEALRRTAQKVASHDEHIHIDILCVDPKIARAGIGKRLFAHVHYHALKARKPLYLDAAPTGSALPFWKSKGFFELARTSSEGLEDAIAMWRRLKKSEHHIGEWSEEWARELVAKPGFQEGD